MNMTRTVRQIVTKVMLGVLLVGPLGGCDTDELITPATDEQRSALQDLQRNDVRFVTGIYLQHNETFLVDEAE